MAEYYQSKHSGEEIDAGIDLVKTKQDKLIAGTGISISGNTISMTGGASPEQIAQIDKNKTDIDTLQTSKLDTKNLATINGQKLDQGGNVTIQGGGIITGAKVKPFVDASGILSFRVEIDSTPGTDFEKPIQRDNKLIITQTYFAKKINEKLEVM